MGKTYKETSWKSKDFEKNQVMKKKPKHRKMDPYNRKRVQAC